MKFQERQNPPPKSWEQFEDLCLDLYRLVWRDPRAQKNGRRGQEQRGVVVFGQVDGTGSFHGVQYKGKDGLFGAKVMNRPGFVGGSNFQIGWSPYERDDQHEKPRLNFGMIVAISDFCNA